MVTADPTALRMGAYVSDFAQATYVGTGAHSKALQPTPRPGGFCLPPNVDTYPVDSDSKIRCVEEVLCSSVC